MADIPALPNTGQKPWSLNPHIAAMNDELNGRLSSENLGSSFVSLGGPTPYYLDAFNQFFSLGGWVSGQSSVSTTASSPSAAGNTTLVVASTTGIVTNTVIVLKPGTSPQSLHKVTGITGSTLTVSPALPVSIAPGEAVSTLWSDSKHLSTAGYQSYWYWVLRRTKKDGTPIIPPGTTGKIVLYADSWGALSTSTFPAAVSAYAPLATAVVSGISGNKSADLVSRFSTDFPADTKYAIFNEPGVNDAANAVSVAAQLSNLDTLVSRMRALGATPILTGAVPLSDTARAAINQSAFLLSATVNWNGSYAPGATVASTLNALITPQEIFDRNTRFGDQSGLSLNGGARNTLYGAGAGQLLTSGNDNLFMGEGAGNVATSGSLNVGIGAQSLKALTTAGNVTAVGANSLRNLTTGGGDTAFGAQSLYSLTTAGFVTGVGYKVYWGLTTGSNNVALGSEAGYLPGGVVANATTTAARQVLIGTQSGQSGSAQLDDVVAIGYRALVGGINAVAVGSGANAGHARSVALGYQVSTTAVDQVAIGSKHFEMIETTDPAAGVTDTARIYVRDNGSGKSQMVVRFATGSVQILATEP